MYEDDDEEMLKKLDVGDAPLDTIDLHNLAANFFQKKIKGLKFKNNKVCDRSLTMLVLPC